MNEFERITQNPAVMGGKPCIRGMRVTVGAIVSQIGAGRCIEAGEARFEMTHEPWGELGAGALEFA